ncbi:DEAD/DEAH box helicase [Pseudoalteromonas agarivorans]|uniref:DEAD/DEAH box helicase n=1 Tax=Pseudoalteromonas agarivorans TaxID=176102 RepID=A0AAD0U2Y4_9GAMM|nr:DEAD/DEAH box helicase family protein [Pseudoalteromonas agarivorans]AYM87030.1 DEAD/DEAH box helicase [Pseudoalteromonas agarivorans]
MKLRKWQAECINKAIESYSHGNQHFLVLATPGAGKTICATRLARELVDRSMVDLVMCFSPTSIVALDFAESLSSEFNSRFDGRLGAMGHSTTYQNMQFLDDFFWQLFREYRVFVIFDEIHHCAGSKVENANSWGEQIISRVQQQAEYTLALTGTPWRSDKTPIVLANYCKDNKIICDYTYGLTEAIKDSVCRVPQITVLDNDDISVINDSECKNFSSFIDLIKQKLVSYKNIVEDEGVISELIYRANRKLEELRVDNKNAGGLIVANSVEHAVDIQLLLKSTIGEDSTIVTYREEFPNEIIRSYRSNSSKWLISVGMVSEGTNIPRLQVCIHLTNIITELHFRQILGRILRFTDLPINIGYQFMLAHPELVDFAYRVAEDVPDEADVVKFEKLSASFKNKTKSHKQKNKTTELISSDADINVSGTYGQTTDEAAGETKNPLTESYEKMLGIVGRFKDEVLELNL